MLPLPQLLALYIHTRNWTREQQAVQVELLALRLERQALLTGLKMEDAQQFVSDLVTRAERLRQPEMLVNKPPPKVDEAGYTDAQLAFLQPWRYGAGATAEDR